MCRAAAASTMLAGSLIVVAFGCSVKRPCSAARRCFSRLAWACISASARSACSSAAADPAGGATSPPCGDSEEAAGSEDHGEVAILLNLKKLNEYLNKELNAQTDISS